MSQNLPHVIPAEGRPFAATWLVTAAWAHPAWSQYAILMYDLTSPGEEMPVVHLEGATHEFLMYALDPALKVDCAADLLDTDRKMFRPLSPPNHGYQFKADTHEAALARLQDVVDGIENKLVSPDTDHRAMWDHFFSDGHSLRR